MTCPLCNGLGERLYTRTHKYTGRKVIVSEYCLCKKSEFISRSFDLLRQLGDQYLPFDKITEALEFNPDNLERSPNILIRGSERDFLLNVKSTIMLYKYEYPSLSFHCCRAIDLLQKFYVKQPDGHTPNLSETQKYDLLIFTLDTKEKNDVLKTCIAQVVNIRKNYRPTWLYLPESNLSECRYDYSPELEDLISKHYVQVNVGYKNSVDKGPNKQQMDSANFGRP